MGWVCPGCSSLGCHLNLRPLVACLPACLPPLAHARAHTQRSFWLHPHPPSPMASSWRPRPTTSSPPAAARRCGAAGRRPRVRPKTWPASCSPAAPAASPRRDCRTLPSLHFFSLCVTHDMTCCPIAGRAGAAAPARGGGKGLMRTGPACPALPRPALHLAGRARHPLQHAVPAGGPGFPAHTGAPLAQRRRLLCRSHFHYCSD